MSVPLPDWVLLVLFAGTSGEIGMLRPAHNEERVVMIFSLRMFVYFGRGDVWVFTGSPGM